MVALGRGIVASAATCIFLAAGKGVVDRGAVLMIHDLPAHDGLTHAFLDGLTHAFLDGLTSPMVEGREGWQTFGMQFRLV